MSGPTRHVRAARSVALVLTAVLLVAACSNRSEDAVTTTAAAVTTEATETTESSATDSPSGDTTAAADTTSPPATEPPGEMFGDLPSPCGAGSATIAEGQNGGDTLVLATATDRGADIAPGLTQEMYDAAVAFASWCNAQGGIAGLEIEVLDADGRLFEVPKMMERICTSAFAMVGGGWAFDDQSFPLFHECDMIDIAGYTVSTAKAMSDGMAQPIPNPTDVRNVGWFVWAKENHADAMSRFATIYPDIPSTKIVEESYIEELDRLGGVEVVDRIPYNAAGEANWAPFAQRLKEAEARTIAFVGSPEQFMPFMRAVREVGYEPELILQEANNYSDLLLNSDVAEGVVLRTNITPFEEADRSAAIADYLAIMESENSDGKVAALGATAMSSYLLFAVGANACLAENDGVLERQCVLAKVNEIEGWTGGGLHAPSNPGTNRPSECTLLLQIVDGQFTRLFPELGSDDDVADGYACDPSWLMEMTGDYGDVNAGKDPDGG